MRPPRPLPRTVTVVSPPESSTQGPRAGSPCSAAERAIPAKTLPTSRASPSIASPSSSGVTPAARATSAAARSDIMRRRDQNVGDRGEARMARLRRLRGGAFEMGDNAGGRVDPIAPEDRQRLGRGRGIGNGRPGGDDRKIVAGNIGDDEADDARRRRRERQPAALDRREMLAHAVHFGDVGAALQQRAVDRALVVERQARRRRGEQRRAAAGNEAKHEIVGAQILDAFENAQRRLFPCGVRHGMGGLDDFDPRVRGAMAIARDDEAFERPAPGRFDRGGHRRGGLARADDDRPPLGRRRQELGEPFRRRGGVDRGLKQAGQECARFDHALPPAALAPHPNPLPRAGEGARPFSRAREKVARRAG